MSEGQSQRSVASSVQHRQQAEVAAAEERKRAAAETIATAARLAMAELTAARAEVEAAAATTDAARATAAELEALRASSTGNSVSADDDRDNKLKLTREAAQEQAAQWATAHPQGRRGGSPDRRGKLVTLQAGARAAAVPPTAVAAQTGADAPAAGLMEIATFIGGAALPHRTGTMVTMGSRPLSGMSVPTVGGLPSPRPTTSSGPR
jgi:hypothetical protein